MGRAEKRKIDKMIKKRLTDEQFTEMKNETINEKVKSEVDRFIANFVEVFIPAMKENRISEERANKIIADINAKASNKYNAGEAGEPRPNNSYVEADEFEKAAERVLKAYAETPPDVLAKILYQEIMKAGKEQ